jgi:uncharacterized membrane-anchored protein
VKNLRLGLFLLVALVQISVPASVIWRYEQTLRHGRVWKFRTRPVDPEDAFRGRYVRLAFAAEDFVDQNESVIPPHLRSVVLKEGADGFAVIDHVSDACGDGDDCFKAEFVWSGRGRKPKFPFDRFYLEEKSAPEVERAYFANSRRGSVNVYATVRAHNGNAALEQLYIDGQPARDYVRSHPKS